MMKKSVFGLALVLLAAASCGRSDISGSGVVEYYSSKDFHGIVLHDRIQKQRYDLAGQAQKHKDIGTTVRYAGDLDKTLSSPAGAPIKVKFTKYEVAGI